jgi:hypothetical protein
VWVIPILLLVLVGVVLLIWSLGRKGRDREVRAPVPGSD